MRLWLFTATLHMNEALRSEITSVSAVVIAEDGEAASEAGLRRVQENDGWSRYNVEAIAIQDVTAEMRDFVRRYPVG